MRSVTQVTQVRALVEAGLNDCEIARCTAIPRRTIQEWRHERRWEQSPYRDGGEDCSRCGGSQHRFEALPPDYAYLLGMYLGDGHIVECARRVYRLSIAMDAAYPGIVEECRTAIAATVPGASPRVHPQSGSRCVYVVKFSKSWPCLFPQHGPGRKHERRIVLSPWQRTIVQRYPGRFVRGLIHSDGCRFMNQVRHGTRTYAYPRYTFSNASGDIRDLFCDACDLLGVEWRVMNARNISVARRPSVARLDEFIGPKR